MFLTMLMLRDPDQIVRLPLRVLAKKANLSDSRENAYRMAAEAVRILSEPDQRSHDDQKYEGRRIKAVDGGYWLILNGAKYDEEMRVLAARIRKTRKQRERRELERQAQSKGGEPLPGEAAAVRAPDRGTAERITEEALPEAARPVEMPAESAARLAGEEDAIGVEDGPPGNGVEEAGPELERGDFEP